MRTQLISKVWKALGVIIGTLLIGLVLSVVLNYPPLIFAFLFGSIFAYFGYMAYLLVLGMFVFTIWRKRTKRRY